MELSTDSRLYDDAVAATKLADERLEPRTRADYDGSLRRFAAFCEREGYPNPLRFRFVELPSVLAAYINQLSNKNQSQWPAEKLRAALAWHYSKPEMLSGGHSHDRWEIRHLSTGEHVAMGNPARSAMISQILVGLNKAKKRARTPTRASPMSLPKLTRMLDFLASDARINETMRVWLSAVGSLCFYGMCRINEVLQMKRGDIQVGLQRKSTIVQSKSVQYGCFTIRDRKTDHDPHASRTYYLHYLSKEERAAEALTHVTRWFQYAETTLHHKWHRGECAFPSLTKIPRGAAKKRRLQDGADDVPGSFQRVGVKWGCAMADNNFTQVLNVIAAASGINESILGDKVWFTSHCFRRGGAQYRFMFAPDRRRWSLKLVKWWAGWSPNEQDETVVRYLLDDVLDREESQLGDSLAPDMIHTVREERTELAPCHSHFDSPPAPNNTLIDEVKECIADTARAVLKDALPIGRVDAGNNGATGATGVPVTEIVRHRTDLPTASSDSTAHLISELPDAKSWRDYVTQYWSNNPSCHQYRAGVDMLPHERRVHRSLLSRMKTIAEFIRSEYADDFDRFEQEFKAAIHNCQAT